MLYIIYYMVFRRNRMTILDDRTLPEGEQYDPHAEGILQAIEKMLPEPFEDVWIESRDGLKLYARFYHMYEEAPVLLFFHGYRSSSIRDGNGIFALCKKLGVNIMMIDQRAHGRSEGLTMTFGVRERYDVLNWIDYAVERLGKTTQIVLAGISMGASTVLMASALPLPESVVGIIADCGFTSAKEIIQKVIRQLHLPAKLAYPFVRLGAKLWGGFDPEEVSAVEAIQECRLPVFLAHGEDDDYVPCQMSTENYNACSAPKQLFTVPGAGHGLCYMIDKEGYLKALREIEKQY